MSDDNNGGALESLAEPSTAVDSSNSDNPNSDIPLLDSFPLDFTLLASPDSANNNNVMMDDDNDIGNLLLEQDEPPTETAYTKFVIPAAASTAARNSSQPVRRPRRAFGSSGTLETKVATTTTTTKADASRAKETTLVGEVAAAAVARRVSTSPPPSGLDMDIDSVDNSNKNENVCILEDNNADDEDEGDDLSSSSGSEEVDAYAKIPVNQEQQEAKNTTETTCIREDNNAGDEDEGDDLSSSSGSEEVDASAKIPVNQEQQEAKNTTETTCIREDNNAGDEDEGDDLSSSSGSEEVDASAKIPVNQEQQEAKNTTEATEAKLLCDASATGDSDIGVADQENDDEAALPSSSKPAKNDQEEEEQQQSLSEEELENENDNASEMELETQPTQPQPSSPEVNENVEATVDGDSKDQEQPPSSLVSSTNATASTSSSSEEKTLPDVASVLHSTDQLFSQVDDQANVTVKDILQSLCAEYDVKKLPKPLKNAVRERLVNLISGEAQPATSLPSSEKTLPDVASLLHSTDQLFLQVDDEATVTVKDILQSLCAEYEVKKLPKPLKNAVRERLVSLISGEVQPGNVAKAENDEDVDDSDNEPSESEPEEMADSEFEQDEEDVSDYEEEVRRKKKKKKKTTSRKPKKNPTTTTPSSSKRRAAQKAKKDALRIQAEKLRRRRMEELRVRNEELQAEVTAEDQARATQIAAKFDTNTDDQRLQRLENRLDLLQQLDRKRSIVIEIAEESPDGKTKGSDDGTKQSHTDKENQENDVKIEENQSSSASASSEEQEGTYGTESSGNEKEAASQNNNTGVVADDEEESDSDSDSDDEELEIVGSQGKQTKFLGVLGKQQPQQGSSPHKTKLDALSLLEMVDRSPHRHQKLLSKKNQQQEQKPISQQSQKQGIACSPGRSLTARAALRNGLLAKQRKMGNNWLARELGYKTEKEHIQDCLEAEKKKRQRNIEREQARFRENERKNLRQRLLAQQQLLPEDEEEEDNVVREEEDNGDEEYKEEEEEDEELQMAKAIENEQGKDSGLLVDPAETQPLPADDGDHDVNDNDETRNTVATAGEAETNKVEKDATKSEESEPSQEVQLETRMPSMEAETNKVENDADKSEESEPSLEAQLETQIPSMEVGEAPSLEMAEQQSLEHDGVNQLPLPAAEADEGETELGNDDLTVPLSSSSVQEEAEQPTKPKGPRNSAWKAMLEKEAEQAKRLKKKRKAGGALVNEEADEEEEEEDVAGLEDFGFSVHKKKQDDDDEEDGADDLNEDDLENVVDELSDNEGDEDAGDEARKALERKEEKERHKEIIRRMRDGYDGRRGGIAAGGTARGVHRFDELVAADNREDAKRLGLLNDDELDSDSDGEGGGKQADADEDDDEVALLDKMLKDRFLHRSSMDAEEKFSEDEDEDEEEDETSGNGNNSDDEDEKEQDRLAKRFAKRARMQRVVDAHGHEEEFSQSRLIEEDKTLKAELQKMKNGLALKRKHSSSRGSGSDNSNTNDTGLADGNKKTKTATNGFGSNFLAAGGSLSLALQASRRSSSRLGKTRTSFLRNASGGSLASETTASLQKSIAFSHVVFHSTDSKSASNISLSKSSGGSMMAPPRRGSGRSQAKKSSKGLSSSKSLWSRTVVAGFQKRR